LTNDEAITVLTTLLKDAQRIRDDRANQFSEIHFTHLHPTMKLYYQERHDEAVAQVSALELAIYHLQKPHCESTT
jgi:hypothetical protein